MDTAVVDPKRFLAMVQGIYRLFRVATFHELTNDAIDVAIRQCLDALRPLADSGLGLTLLFARETVIVNGQLLQAPPDIYKLAMEFGAFMLAADVNSLSVGRDVEESDLRALLLFFNERKSLLMRLDLSEEDADALDGNELARPRQTTVVPDAKGYISPAIRLRTIAERFLLGLEDPTLSAFERIMLTYALATLVIRRLGEATARGHFEVPAYFKRVARQLAQVNYVERPRILDIIVSQHLDDDEAKRSVNSAILAVAMTRLMTRNDTVLSRVCLASMLLGMGRFRPESGGHSLTGRERALATAAVHIGAGHLRGDSVERALVSFESISLLEGLPGDLVYRTHESPTIDAYITMTARRFIDRLTDHRSAGRAISMDVVIERMREQCESDIGRLCIDLLVSALSLLPRGSAVELEQGYRGVVTRAGARPSTFDRPRVRIIVHPRGHRIDEPYEVDLGEDEEALARHGVVTRVLASPGPMLEAVRRNDFAAAWAWDEARVQVVSTLTERLDADASRITSTLTPGSEDTADEVPEFRGAPTDEFDVARHSGVYRVAPSTFDSRSGSEVRSGEQATAPPAPTPAEVRHAMRTPHPAPQFSERPQSAARRVAPTPRPEVGFGDRPSSGPRRGTPTPHPAPQFTEGAGSGIRRRTVTPNPAPQFQERGDSGVRPADDPSAARTAMPRDRRTTELSRRGANQSAEIDSALQGYLTGQHAAIEAGAGETSPDEMVTRPVGMQPIDPTAFDDRAASALRRSAPSGLRPSLPQGTPALRSGEAPRRPNLDAARAASSRTEAPVEGERRRARRTVSGQLAAVTTPYPTRNKPAEGDLDDLLRGFMSEGEAAEEETGSADD